MILNSNKLLKEYILKGFTYSNKVIVTDNVISEINNNDYFVISQKGIKTIIKTDNFLIHSKNIIPAWYYNSDNTLYLTDGLAMFVVPTKLEIDIDINKYIVKLAHFNDSELYINKENKTFFIKIFDNLVQIDVNKANDNERKLVYSQYKNLWNRQKEIFNNKEKTLYLCDIDMNKCKEAKTNDILTFGNNETEKTQVYFKEKNYELDPNIPSIFYDKIKKVTKDFIVKAVIVKTKGLNSERNLAYGYFFNSKNGVCGFCMPTI